MEDDGSSKAEGKDKGEVDGEEEGGMNSASAVPARSSSLSASAAAEGEAEAEGDAAPSSSRMSTRESNPEPRVLAVDAAARQEDSGNSGVADDTVVSSGGEGGEGAEGDDGVAAPGSGASDVAVVDESALRGGVRGSNEPSAAGEVAAAVGKLSVEEAAQLEAQQVEELEERASFMAQIMGVAGRITPAMQAVRVRGRGG